MGLKSFFYALATLVGTIIGVGLFSLPYITVRVGLLTMVGYFVLLGLVVALVNLIFGEVVLRTKGKKRLPGYAQRYLGQGGKVVAFVSSAAGFIGAQLAYLIVGGTFLFSLFSPWLGGSSLLYTLIFFALGALLIYFGIKSIAQTELLALLLFFVVLLLIFIYGSPSIELNNLVHFDHQYLFLPYGAVLFSLGGMSLIPEIKEMLSHQRHQLKKILWLAVLIPALTYLFFIFLITGITGDQTTPEAIVGLRSFFSPDLVNLALAFGVLTTFTSFLTLGLTLKKVLWYDLRLSRDFSWLLACGLPLLLFLLGFKSFIKVISLTGGVTLGINATIIILCYLKAKKKGDYQPAYQISLPSWLAYGLLIFFALAVFYQAYYLWGFD